MSGDPTFSPMEHSVYLGRERLGRYLRTEPQRFVAFDADDKKVGNFRNQKDACAAIAAAHSQGQR